MKIETNIFYTSTGQKIVLGNQLKSGGEGAIFEIPGNSAKLAKIFYKGVRAEKTPKLRSMTDNINLSSSDVITICAWPLELLFSEKNKIEVAGFIMAKITDHDDIHLLYGTKSRRKYFNHARWKFLIYTALNIATSFKTLHQNNIIIGDINHGSVMVSQKATVRLVDCDSFQIKRHGKFYLCDVGTGTHTPPELQGKSLNNIVRTVEHDLFGLGVLIFQLLFLGRHPFSGTPTDNTELTIEEAIKGYRFAYGADVSSRKMKQPKATPSLSIVPFENLFRRAFLPGQFRPTAQEWAKELNALKDNIKVCNLNNGHQYWSQLEKCPWCKIETEIKTTLFDRIFGKFTNFDLKKLWVEIDSVYQKPVISINTLIKSLKLNPQQDNVLPKSVWVGVGGFYFVFIIAVLSISSLPIEETSGLGAMFGFTFIISIVFFISSVFFVNSYLKSKIYNKLQKQKTEYEDIPQYKTRLLEDLKKKAKENQLKKFLDGYRISDYSIPNIGPVRSSQLWAAGIETAADIEFGKIIRLHGFGYSTAGDLMAWRQSIANKFVFNPNSSISKWELDEIDNDVNAKKIQLETSLEEGLKSIKSLSESPLRLNYLAVFFVPFLVTSIAGFNIGNLRAYWATQLSAINSKNTSSSSPSPSPIDTNKFVGNSNITNINSNINLNINANANLVTPETATDFFDRGVKYTRAQNYELAAKDYSEAVKLKEDYSDAWHELSYAYLKLKDYEKCITSADKALSYRPDYLETLRVKGQAFLAQNKWKESSEIFQKLINRSGKNPQDFYNLGLSNLGNMEYSESISNFQDAIRIKPSWNIAYYNLGLAQAKAGETEQAWETYYYLLKKDKKLADKLSSVILNEE